MSEETQEWPKIEEPAEMGAQEFQDALFALGNSYGRRHDPFPLTRLAPAVGRTVRTLSKYKNEGNVDPAVAKLVRMFVVHGEVF